MTAPRAPANRAEVAALIAHAATHLTVTGRLSGHDILAALEVAGVRLVPMEATREMTDAIVGPGVPQWRWEDALAASPYAPEGGQ